MGVGITKGFRVYAWRTVHSGRYRFGPQRGKFYHRGELISAEGGVFISTRLDTAEHYLPRHPDKREDGTRHPRAGQPLARVVILDRLPGRWVDMDAFFRHVQERHRVQFGPNPEAAARSRDSIIDALEGRTPRRRA